jgi:hypothetical protein
MFAITFDQIRDKLLCYEHIFFSFDVSNPSFLLFHGSIATHQSHTNSEEPTSSISSVLYIINSKTLFFFDIIFFGLNF